MKNFFDNLFNQPPKENLKNLSNNLLDQERSLKKLRKDLSIANANAHEAYDTHKDDETVRKLSAVKIDISLKLANLQETIKNLSEKIAQRQATIIKRKDELALITQSNPRRDKERTELSEITPILRKTIINKEDLYTSYLNEYL